MYTNTHTHIYIYICIYIYIHTHNYLWMGCFAKGRQPSFSIGRLAAARCRAAARMPFSCSTIATRPCGRSWGLRWFRV